MRGAGFIALVCCSVACAAAGPERAQPLPVSSASVGSSPDNSARSAHPAASAENVAQLPPGLTSQDVLKRLRDVIEPRPRLAKYEREAWLGPKTSIVVVDASCWNVRADAEQLGSFHLFVKYEGCHLTTDPAAHRGQRIATFRIHPETRELAWQDGDRLRSMVEFERTREATLRAAADRVRERLIDEALFFHDEMGIAESVRFRIAQAAAESVIVEVIGRNSKKRLAAFRVPDNSEQPLTWIQQERAAPFSEFAAQQRERYHPAVLAMSRTLPYQAVPSCLWLRRAVAPDTFEVAASAEAREDACTGASRVDDRFLVNMRQLQLSWWHQGRWQPIDRFVTEVARRARRAVRLVHRYLDRHPEIYGKQCRGIIAEGVEGQVVTVRLHIAPPCNDSMLLMTMGWFLVDLTSGKVVRGDDGE